MIRVRLKENADCHLPTGATGTVIKGFPDDPGMSMVRWDWSIEIPMYNSEIEVIKDNLRPAPLT